MNDPLLQDDVLDELRYDPSLDASNIAVRAKEGVVTLSGHVASYAEKLAAERAAWRVSGVKAIALEIEVHVPSDLALMQRPPWTPTFANPSPFLPSFPRRRESVWALM